MRQLCVAGSAIPSASAAVVLGMARQGDQQCARLTNDDEFAGFSDARSYASGVDAVPRSGIKPSGARIHNLGLLQIHGYAPSGTTRCPTGVMTMRGINPVKTRRTRSRPY